MPMMGAIMVSDARAPRFGPGTTYRTRGKHPRECEVVDVLFTYNLAGELVRVRYVTIHTLMGQEIQDIDVVETTIAMGLISAVPFQNGDDHGSD